MTVDELLSRMSSREITEWRVFFDLQQEELERNRRRAQRDTAGTKQRPVIGDTQMRGDAITEARKAQGLE